MLRIRPVALEDVDDVLRLAELAGQGMTSLPQDREALLNNIETAVASFHRTNPDPADYFLMVMEDLDKQKVIGTAAVYARTGARQAFYAYRLMSVTHFSHSLAREIRSSLLHLTNDYTGYSEMGTLFLDPEYRGNGHWLSRSRYLLLGLFPERFSDYVIAELRGWFDDAGQSPFWQAIGEKFFAMSYEEADRLCGVGSNQFITELMPKYPIYTNLLTDSAVEVMGKPHQATKRAMELLLDEGFEYENVIDIFDGGPLVKARVDKLDSVTKLKRINWRESTEVDAEPMLLANNNLADFRVVFEPAEYGEEISIASNVAEALGVKAGATIAVVDKGRE